MDCLTHRISRFRTFLSISSEESPSGLAPRFPWKSAQFGLNGQSRKAKWVENEGRVILKFSERQVVKRNDFASN